MSKTLKVRPISYDEIVALVKDPESTLEGFHVRNHPVYGEVLVAMTYRLKTHGGVKTNEQIVYAVMPDDRPGHEGKIKFDATQPVGLRVNLSTESQFGSESSVTLYTSREAEEAVNLIADHGRGADFHAGDARLSLVVPDEKGTEVPFMPLYGSEANTSVLVKDVPHEEVTARIEKALKAEFGDEVKFLKLQSRPVADLRVNIYNFADDTPLAVNVLEAEAHLIAKGAHRTEYVTKDMIVGS